VPAHADAIAALAARELAAWDGGDRPLREPAMRA
jgi:hypothetical protein